MSNKKDSLGDRMKEFYENRAKVYLTRRTPVIIRLDGKAFHSFTKGFKKPYDEIFHNTMNETMKYLCENIQGCKIGYTQSDEITLLLTDYDTLTTDAWFNYGMQKMCSIAASMATMVFNRYFDEQVDEYCKENYINCCGLRDVLSIYSIPELKEVDSVLVAYLNSIDKGAMFDARVFNIPKEEITNCFIWRQQDATRNAIQMLGQCNFSHQELQGKSCNDIQDMLMIQKNINFNDMATAFKRGACCIKTENEGWVIDTEIPIFTQDREYIEKRFHNEGE